MENHGLEISPEQLRSLVATVQEGTFTGAARLLQKSQSAVSQNIATLEAALGLRLFDRTGYRPTLTPAGTRVLELARRMVGELDELAGIARSLGAGVEAVLSIAVDEFFPMDCLLRGLRELRARHPKTRLQVRTGPLGEVAEMVVRGIAQIGISGPLENEPEGLVRQRVTSIGLVPVTAKTHPLAKIRGVLSAKALRPHVQITLTDRSPYTEGARRGVVDSDQCLVGSLSTKRAFLLEGFGWGTMPHHLIDDDLREGTLVRVRPEGWDEGELLVPLDVIHLDHAPPGPAGRFLIDRLTQLAGGSMPEPSRRRRSTLSGAEQTRSNVSTSIDAVPTARVAVLEGGGAPSTVGRARRKR